MDISYYYTEAEFERGVINSIKSNCFQVLREFNVTGDFHPDWWSYQLWLMKDGWVISKNLLFDVMMANEKGTYAASLSESRYDELENQALNELLQVPQHRDTLLLFFNP